MLDLLYLVCIAPLEFCMSHILEWGFDLTKSYGFALIFMSLAVNTVILPIYNKVEGWQEDERALKARMAPMENMIREVFKGQERFAMVTTLYRQHGYSQLMTLRASIGVLLQVPFFFAAYHLLSNMEALHGVSFGPIRDLGAADALFVIGGVSINVLPILMTVVNLISAFYYTHGLSRRDKIQLYGMAALFLVLLYNSPAALTFYWTLNNVYSLGKNIVEKDWMRRQGWTASIQKMADLRRGLCEKACGLCSRGRSAQVNVSAIIAILGFAGLFMLVRGLLGHGKYSFEMSSMLLGVFLLLMGISYLAKEKFEGIKKMPLLQAAALLAGVIGISYILAKYGFHQGSAKKVALKMGLVAGIASILTCGRSFLAKVYARVAPQKNELGALFLPSAALIAFLIFVYCPFMVFSSDPAVFEMKLEDFASGRFGTFFVAMICLAVIGVLVSPVKWVLGSACVMMAIAALTFCFVVAPDVGVMDAFVFQKPEALTRWYNVYIDAAVIMAVVFVFMAAVRLRKAKTLANVIYASLTVLVVMTGVHYHTAKDTLASITQHNEADTEFEIPQYVKDFYTFSKHGKNIVVVMLDMFTGGNMNQLLEMHPELKTELDGFTWYEDTITSGSSTLLATAGILGGEAATPFELNKNKQDSLEKRINYLYHKFIKNIQKKDFHVSISDSIWLDTDMLDSDVKCSKNILTKKILKDAINYNSKANNINARKKIKYSNFFTQFGVFLSVPSSIKSFIYTNGSWMSTIETQSEGLKHSLRELSSLEVLPIVSSVSDNVQNKFIYFTNELCHAPWHIDENGLPSNHGGSYSSCDYKNKNGLSEFHLRAEYTAIKKLIAWIEWMKNENIYDNTQIIFVSDHGAHDSAEMVKALGQNYPRRAQVLLLVKERNIRNALHINRNTQMGNWDVPSLILRSLDEKKNHLKKIGDSAPRVRYHTNGHWVRDRHKEREFLLEEIYTLQGPIYNKESWIKVK